MARSFNGATDKLTVANSIIHKPELGSYSVAIWVKRTRTTSIETVLACGNATSNTAGWAIGLNATGLLFYRVSDGTANARVDLTSGFADTTSWHLLQFDINRTSGKLEGYFDGSAVGFTPNGTDSIASLGSILPTGSLIAGQYDSAAGPFVGSIGPIAILKGRVSTSQERADLAAGKPALQVWHGYNLAACYPLCGPDLSEYASALADAPFVATGTTSVASPVQVWTLADETQWASDTYTGTDGTDASAHVADTGQTLAYHPYSSSGIAEIRSNALSRPVGSTSSVQLMMTGNPPGRGVGRIKADLTLTNAANNQAYSLIVRAATGADSHVGCALDIATSAYRWFTKIAGTVTSYPGEPWTPTAATYNLTADVNNTRYFLFNGTSLVASLRNENAVFRDLPIWQGNRLTGGTAEPSPATWHVDNVKVQYPFTIKEVATGTPTSTTVGVYAGFHLPGILKTRDYALPWAECRYGDGNDDKVKDIVFWRAPISDPTNFGSPIVARGDGSAYTALVQNPVAFVLADQTTIVLLYVKYPTGSASFPASQFCAPTALQGLTGNTGTVWKVVSTDQGATWGSPVEITTQVKVSTEYGVYLGPGPGTRITTGAHAGRIICGYGYNTATGTVTAGPASGPAGCIYSDDNGATWARGGAAPTVAEGEETNIVLLSDGATLVMNRRNALTDINGRIFNYSTDGGATWGADVAEPEILSPPSSVFTGMTAAFGGTAYVHSNAINGRERITVRIGDTNADNWSADNPSGFAGRISGGRMLEWSEAAYSSIAAITSGGTDYVLACYVAGNRATVGTSVPYEDRLTVAAVPRTWLGLSATPTLVPGTATGGAVTSTTAAATATAATGGQVPITLQWQRTLTSGSGYASVSGQTTTTLADTGLTPATIYYYRLAYTDAYGTVAYSNEISRTTSAAVATAYTLTGPSTGIVGVASTAFTVTPNGAFTGTITPSDASGGGTFTPTSLTWSGTSDAKTFAYTPASAGAKAIATTNSGSLTNPSGLTYTATAALAAGTATAGAVTSTTAAATATDATGGTTPIAYQWFRSTTSGQLGSAVSGQTTRTLADSGLASSSAYYYTLRYTDSASAVVYSNQITLTTASAVSPSISDEDIARIVAALLAQATITPIASFVAAIGDVTPDGIQAAINLKADQIAAIVTVPSKEEVAAATWAAADAIEPGESAAQTFRALRARDIGQWDRIAGNIVFYRKDNVTVAFTTPVPTGTSRGPSTLGGGL